MKRVATKTDAGVGDNSFKRKKTTDAVSKSIEGLDEVPCMVRAMLIDMLPGCFGTPPEQRHAFQDGTASIIAELFNKVECDLDVQISGEKLKASSADREQEDREKIVASALNVLEERQASTLASKKLLAETARKFRATKAALAEAVADSERCEDEVKTAAETRVKLDTLLFATVKPLCEGTVPQEDVRKMANSVIAVLQEYDFGSSILLALPDAFSVAPQARGQFDNVVISQVQDEIKQRLESVENTLINQQPIKMQRLEAMRQVECELRSAKEEQKVLAKAFLSTAAAQEEQERGHSDAKQRLRDLGPEMKKVAKATEQMQKKLAKFQDGPLAAFKELKNWTAVEITPQAVENTQADSLADAEEEAEPNPVPTKAIVEPAATSVLASAVAGA